MTNLTASLFLCGIRLKLNLSFNLLLFFNILISIISYIIHIIFYIIYIIPNIIIDHPVIFIIMTISNIITLYIAYLSIFDKNVNLRENIIHLFNILKEYKFHPFKFLKYIIIHLKKWIYIKFKQLKDNWLFILLTLFIIIFIANVFRQPIFYCLGINIFSNPYLYMYVMFSSILPTTYIIIILTKWLKTKNLDLSFRLIDFKDKITILSILFLFISLYISYFYIWPLIGFSIIYLILNLWNIPPILSGLSPSILMVLPGLSVAGVFQHFESSFTKDEILSTIENYEPDTLNANYSNQLTRYSHDRWISKVAISDNIETNAEYSRKNIKTPYIPTKLFKSYWDNFGINKELKDYNNLNKDVAINMALYYLKGDNNFYHCLGRSEQLFDLQTYWMHKHCVMFAESNKPISEILKQMNLYANSTERVPHIADNNEKSPFFVLYNRKRIAFGMQEPIQNSNLRQNYPFKKGHSLYSLSDLREHTDTPDLSRIIGLVATNWGVETIPHQNVYRPQLAFYDVANEKHAFAIHMLFKYLSINKWKPELNDNFIQINDIEENSINLTEKLNGEDDLNIKLEQNGRLLREI